MVYHPHQFFAKNTAGRDFVVGDLHGSLGALTREMNKVNFDPKKDRIFSVGDLIDRGPDSLGCLALLNQPWFNAVLGNHEDMMISAVKTGDMRDVWESHGGEWNRLVDSNVLFNWVLELEKLPIAITVETDDGRIGITHASPPDDWMEAINHTESHRMNFLWSRSKFMYDDESICVNVDKTVHGHTPTVLVKQLGNSYFIDTNKRYDGSITLLRIQ